MGFRIRIFAHNSSKIYSFFIFIDPFASSCIFIQKLFGVCGQNTLAWFIVGMTQYVFSLHALVYIVKPTSPNPSKPTLIGRRPQELLKPPGDLFESLSGVCHLIGVPRKSAHLGCIANGGGHPPDGKEERALLPG